MVLAPAAAKNTAKEEDAGYICAAVRPSDEVDQAYELFVADQRVIKTPALGELVMLKYERKTRCYHIGG